MATTSSGELACLLFLATFLCVTCCTNKKTFENTAITALKDIELDHEIADYNFFARVKPARMVSIHHVTGCLEPYNELEELEEAVAIQIRDQKVPIMYESSVQHLPLLHSLHVESSQVNILKPNAFHNLPSLAIIKFIDNNINTIPAEVFSGLKVHKVVLFLNRIEHISAGAFDNMPNLKSVNLDHNNLSTWNTDWFTKSPNVQYISVKYNHLTSLPAWAFRNIQDALQRIYLTGNNLKYISETAFLGLRNLTDIDLRDNRELNQLYNTTFYNLGSLKMIDLSGTAVECLTRGFLFELRLDVNLWFDRIPFNWTCLDALEEWKATRNVTLKLYNSLRNATSAEMKKKGVK